MTRKYFKLIAIASILLFPLSLMADDDDGWGFTILPLPSYNDDIGFTYGLRVTTAKKSKDYEPYEMKFWAQYLGSTKGYEDHAVHADILDVFGSGLRVKMQGGFARTLVAQYYGYGNEQDIRRIQKVQEGRIAVGENIPATRSILEGSDIGWVDGKFAEEFNVNENFLADPAGSFQNGTAFIHGVNTTPLKERNIAVGFMGLQSVGKYKFIAKIIEEGGQDFYILAPGKSQSAELIMATGCFANTFIVQICKYPRIWIGLSFAGA